MKWKESWENLNGCLQMGSISNSHRAKKKFPHVKITIGLMSLILMVENVNIVKGVVNYRKYSY